MNITKKIFGIAFIGIALAASVTANARLSGNRIAANTFSSNSLAGDGAFNTVSAIVLRDGTRY
jgi:hypothetical protein